MLSRAFAIYERTAGEENQLVASAYANKGDLRREQARRRPSSYEMQETVVLNRGGMG